MEKRPLNKYDFIGYFGVALWVVGVILMLYSQYSGYEETSPNHFAFNPLIIIVFIAGAVAMWISWQDESGLKYRESKSTDDDPLGIL